MVETSLDPDNTDFGQNPDASALRSMNTLWSVRAAVTPLRRGQPFRAGWGRPSGLESTEPVQRRSSYNSAPEKEWVPVGIRLFLLDISIFLKKGGKSRFM